MSTVLDYLKWRGDLTFSQVPFNAVDSVVCCMLSYFDFKDIVPGVPTRKSVPLRDALTALSEKKNEKSRVHWGLFASPYEEEFLALLQKSKRYERMKLNYYVCHTSKNQEKQFAAITCQLGDGTMFVTYRGTDDTLVGWKEDFNMSYLRAIPSQNEAVRYLKKASSLRGRIRIGGHSKGGNLAVYAGVSCDKTLRKRIIGIYNLDGPGNSKSFVHSKAFFLMKNRIHIYIPHFSVVGLLFYHGKGYHIVESTGKGMMQHDPFTWQINGSGFVKGNAVAYQSVIVNRMLGEYLSKTSKEEVKQFMDTAYRVLTKDDMETLTDLSKFGVFLWLKSLTKVKKEDKMLLWKEAKRFLSMYNKHKKKIVHNYRVKKTKTLLSKFK